MAARTYIRPLISVSLIVLTVLGLNNVYGDNADVQSRAEELACGSAANCSTNLVQLERTVLAQTFTFQVRGSQAPGVGSTATVRCQREFIFAGGYSCKSQ